MFQKGKDMTTMNRLFVMNRDSLKSAQLAERELCFDFMRSSTDKHKRGNCVLDIGLQL